LNAILLLLDTSLRREKRSMHDFKFFLNNPYWLYLHFIFFFTAVMGFQYRCAPGCKRSSRDKSVLFFIRTEVKKMLAIKQYEQKHILQRKFGRRTFNIYRWMARRIKPESKRKWIVFEFLSLFLAVNISENKAEIINGLRCL